MAKAIGIGGIFFRSSDPKALAAWYAQHLGVPTGDGGLAFDGPESTGMTLFTPFKRDTSYFAPTGEAAAPQRESPQQFMVNFRVDNLDQLLIQLAKAGIPIAPRPEDESFGKFAWIWDPEGNRIELWEPLP